MSKNGEIRRDENCLVFNGEFGQIDKIFTFECHGQFGNQNWTVDNGLIRHQSGYCIEINSDKIGIFMQRCDLNNPRQIWKWKKREPKKI